MSTKPVAAFRTNLRACWITTYNLDLGLYDSFLFPRLGDPPLNAVVLADGHRLDHTLEAIPPDEQWRLQRANRRWLLRGLRAGGAFHPKTILLADTSAVRLLVGSGNLSLSGLEVGFETFTEFTSSDPEGAAAIAGWVSWMHRIVHQQGDAELAGRFARLVADLPASVEVAAGGFLHNLDGPLLDSLVTAVAERPVERLHLAAPFYDQQLAAVDTLLQRLEPRTVVVYLTERTSVDGRELRKLLKRRGVEDELLRYVDEKDSPVGFVHAKLIGVELDDGSALLLSGSANLSRAALMATDGVEAYANIETATLTALSVDELRHRFVDPPRLNTQPVPPEIAEALTLEPDKEGQLPPVKLMRASRNANGSVAVVVDGPLADEWLLTDGDETGRPNLDPLTGRLVWLIDQTGETVSNRVVVDEPRDLQRELEEPSSSGTGHPGELLVSDLDHPLGAILNYLQQTCVMDVAETRAVELAERAGGTEGDESSETGLWERLASDELRRDPRISTYDRLRGHTHGLVDPLADLLAAMLARTPPEARDALSNVIPFPVPDPDPGDGTDGGGGDVAKHRWSTSTRIRVRARNVLRRWADAVGDERMQWIDPLAPLTNFRVLLDALAWLYAIHHKTDEGAVLTEDDLDQVFRRLVDAILAPLSKTDDVRSALPEHTLSLVAGLLYLALRPGTDYRGRVLDWQPRIQALLDLDLLEATDISARFVGEVLWLEIAASDIEAELLYAVDFIDDEEWCRRTAAELELASVALEVSSQNQQLDARITVAGVDTPLSDPVTLRLLAALEEYRGATSVAIFDANGRWRLAIEPGETVALRASWLDERFVESRQTLSPRHLRRLIAAGGSLAELFAPQHRAAS
ncbi:MAG: hypothetical protein WEB09_01110 [Nitriliruptor sp.]